MSWLHTLNLCTVLYSPAPSTYDVDDSVGDSCVELPFFHLSELDIDEALKTLPDKAPGIDNIPPKLFKLLSPSVKKCLIHIFNNSLEQKIFPDLLKKTIVTAVPKKGPKDISNHRPICCLTALSKRYPQSSTNLLSHSTIQNI
uniref:Reverse transcriptase n=1 Tax=Cacopsylla melanoneura TaxID=428564 RepID=A0A8D9E0G9_9HEMI